MIGADISLTKTEKKVVKTNLTIVNEANSFIAEFRNKWHGAKAGAMGSKQACLHKMTRWMKENPEVTPEQILAAADLYISTEGKKSRYLQRADYFIYKQESDKTAASRLSAFVDEILMGTTNDDWTSQLK